MTSASNMVTLKVMTDGNRAVAEATLFAANHDKLTGDGSAGREPGDKSLRRIGEDLAMARALRSLASHLERQAAGTVKHREDIKKHRRELKGRVTTDKRHLKAAKSE